MSTAKGKTRKERRLLRTSFIWRGGVRVWLLVLISLVILACVALGAGAAILPHGDHIARGVSAVGVDVGGFSRAAAKQRILTRYQDILANTLTLHAGPNQRRVQLKDLGFTPNLHSTIEGAYQVGRKGPFFMRVVSAFNALRLPVSLAPAYVFDAKRATGMLTAYSDAVDNDPIDARAQWNAGAHRLDITPEQTGASLDVPAAVTMVEQEVAHPLMQGQPAPADLHLPYEVTPPKITAEMLKSADTILGSYTTSFSSSSRNRANNVTLGAKALDGFIVPPGAVFSFNKAVGPRTAAKGFEMAPVIVHGLLQPGIGGGMCQVSTTLYNAALLANMTIVSRSHHTLPSHYVPLGMDATVSFGAIDFRFKNDSTVPVVIDSQVEGRKLTFRLIGKGPAPVVHIERSGIGTFPGRTLTEPDPKLPPGKRAVKHKGTIGRTVTVTRVIGEGPGATREVISHDKYTGEPTIIGVGVKGPAPKPGPADHGDNAEDTPGL